MQRARVVPGFGWVDLESGRVELPDGAGVRAGAAPNGALPLQLVEDARGRLALVRGPLLGDERRRALAAILAAHSSEVVFLVASEGGAYVLDPDADVVRAAEALVAVQRDRDGESDHVAVFSASAAWAHADEPARLVVRALAPLEEAYERASGAVALLRADVDRMMVYNDWLGFVEGDLLLARVLRMASSLAERPAALSLHRRDLLILLEGLDEARATAASEQLVQAMRRARVQLRHPEVRNQPYVTLSVGAVYVPSPRGVKLGRALEEVDAAVQGAKLAGRNRARLTRLES